MNISERIGHYIVPVGFKDIEGYSQMSLQELDDLRKKFLPKKQATYGIIPSTITAGVFEMLTLQPINCAIGAVILAAITIPNIVKWTNLAAGTRVLKDSMKDKK